LKKQVCLQASPQNPETASKQNGLKRKKGEPGRLKPAKGGRPKVTKPQEGGENVGGKEVENNPKKKNHNGDNPGERFCFS